MSSIDIRSDNIVVDSIVFADSGHEDACVLFLDDAQKVTIANDPESMESYRYVQINSSDDAKNLIKALEKALEMGWV